MRAAHFVNPFYISTGCCICIRADLNFLFTQLGGDVERGGGGRGRGGGGGGGGGGDLETSKPYFSSCDIVALSIGETTLRFTCLIYAYMSLKVSKEEIDVLKRDL
jgi:hypothetical protein